MALATFLIASSLAVFGQSGTAPLSGLVLDPNGSAVHGANVVVKNEATGAETTTTTTSTGTYTVPSLGAGSYTVTIEAPGFKKAVLQGVKMDVGVAATANATLEVGAASETVVVEGAGEILQTQSATVSTTLQTKQIGSLPLQSRNTIYFLTMLPGVSAAATASPRNATVNGLPSTAYNITIDGLNTQDNLNKNTDGFFSFIAPSVDAIQEVSISTATPGAESAGQGAIQIKFATRSGTNDYHGSAYEYHRNTVLNSNYWFTNRDVTPYDVQTAKLCNGSATGEPYDPDKCKAPRAPNLFNQFGGRIGGPISIPKLFNGKDRAFFFVNFEEFRQPNSVSRTRTILSPDAQAGIFKYTGGPAAGINLLTLGGQTATMDPTIKQVLAEIRNSSTSVGGVKAGNDPNLQSFTFNNASMGLRYFPTVRFDFNLSSKHTLSNTYNYQSYVTTVDTLNNVDPSFPGFANHGGQFSNRFADSLTLRSTLTPRLVNEARAGFTGGTVLFFPEVNPGQFADQGGFAIGTSATSTTTGFGPLGLSNPTVTNAPERRNAPVWDFADNVTWTRGAHSFSFGGQFTQAGLWINDQNVVPSLNFGIVTGDSAGNLVSSAFPSGTSNAVITAAQNLYAILTGRISSITANAVLDEKTNQYQYLAAQVRRGRQREWGFFAQDSWRATPNLTLTYGLRYELQLPFSVQNGIYTTSTPASLFGISGPGNLFKPNVQSGSPTQFTQFNDGDAAYKTDKNNFAPSLGFAYSLPAQSGWLKRIFGEAGQTVIRGGYSVAYERQGSATFLNFDNNPGITLSATRSATIGNLATAQCPTPVLLSQTSCLGAPAFPSTPNYPFVAGTSAVSISSTAFVFDPNIKTPYAQSWTLSVQRELTKDTVFEARYVHTINLQTWLNYNLNEVNTQENGFLNEFKLAQANLQANIKAGNGNTFAYTGAAGTSPLPIYYAYFQGAGDPRVAGAANYSSKNWGDSNFTGPLALNNPNPGGAGSTTGPASSNSSQGLFGNATLRANAKAAGLPSNFFIANPDLLGGAFIEGNGGYNKYDGLSLELRHRLTKGLLVEGNYTFAKAFTAQAYSFRNDRSNLTTITNTGGNTGTNTGGTLLHQFKANWLYELPIGKGKSFLGSPHGFAGGLIDKVVGGWAWNGTARIQTGSNIDFGNVNLVGMTRDDLQKSLKPRFDDANGFAYFLPQDIIDNTIKAFNVSATSATGYSTRGAPTGRYIAPANGANCIQVVRGDCGFTDLFVRGPIFTRFDLSAVKTFRISERMNFEFRAEFLNAFNNINYLYPTSFTFTSDDFGKITSAYRDVNNTQDPGGRLIQLVGRFNF
jgi:hypothetical protein